MYSLLIKGVAFASKFVAKTWSIKKASLKYRVHNNSLCCVRHLRSNGFNCSSDILDEILERQVQETMREKGFWFCLEPDNFEIDILLVEQEITNQIDELVKEQVAECLKAHIPKELQDEVAMSKKELEELNLRLHNSWVVLFVFSCVQV